MSTIQPTDTDDSDYPVKRQETKSLIPLMIYCLILAFAYTQATEYEKPHVFLDFVVGIVLYLLYTKIFVALGMSTGERTMMLLLLFLLEPAWRTPRLMLAVSKKL